VSGSQIFLEDTLNLQALSKRIIVPPHHSHMRSFFIQIQPEKSSKTNADCNLSERSFSTN